MIDFNPTGEHQFIARNRDGQVVTLPRRSTNKMRRSLDELQRDGLTFLAVVLLNCSPRYIYSWRDDLESHHWLGIELEMARRPSGEFKGKMHAWMQPARRRHYSLDWQGDDLRLLTGV